MCCLAVYGKDVKSSDDLQLLMMCLLLTVYGKDVKSSDDLQLDAEPLHPGKNTVTYEARQIKAIMLQLI